MKRKAASILLILLVACFSATAIAEGYNSHPRPFMGFMSGVAEFPFDPTESPCLNLTGVPWQTESIMFGDVSHLGRTTYYSTHCANLETNGLDYGEARLVAANGDEVWLTYSADLVDAIPVSPPDLMPVTLVYAVHNVVTGGTGRFEDATGEFLALIFVRIDEFVIPSPPAPIRMEFAGTILY